MKQGPLRVAVAVPTFNSAAYITPLLVYLSHLPFYKIYILDDASTDTTVAICQQFPKVTVIAGNTNVGPTRNRNRILAKDIGDILVFLDDDMQWRAGDLLSTIYTHFKTPRLGALGFAIFDTRGKELWFGNDHESNPLFFWAIHPFTKPLTAAQRQQSFLAVQWLLEGSFAVRSHLFLALGGFDKRFKRYQEGPDLCRRLRKHGYQIGYTHDVQFTHTKPLSVFRLSQIGQYLRSGILWHILHRGKIPCEKTVVNKS